MHLFATWMCHSQDLKHLKVLITYRVAFSGLLLYYNTYIMRLIRAGPQRISSLKGMVN